MKNPMVIYSGSTFEKVSIEEHLKNNDTDPLNRKKLFTQKMIPNQLVKSIIDNEIQKWKERHQIHPKDLPDEEEIIIIERPYQNQKTIGEMPKITQISDEKIRKIIAQILARDVNLEIKKLIKNISKKNNSSLKNLIIKIENLNNLRIKKFKFNDYDGETFKQFLKTFTDFYYVTSSKRYFKHCAFGTIGCFGNLFGVLPATACTGGTAAAPWLLAKHTNILDYSFLGSLTIVASYTLPVLMALLWCVMIAALCAGVVRSMYHCSFFAHPQRTSEKQNLKQKICSEISNHWNSVDECLEFLENLIDKQIEISKLIEDILEFIKSHSSQNQLDNFIDIITNALNKYNDASSVDLNTLHNELKQLKDEFADENSLLLERYVTTNTV